MAESTIKAPSIARSLNTPSDWNDIFTTTPLGTIHAYTLSNATSATNAPSDNTYNYGVLLTYRDSSTWNNLQMFVPSTTARGHMYIRTDISDCWKRFDSVATTQVSITVANWNATTTCTKSVTGVTSSNSVIVTPAPASISTWTSNGVYCSAQGSGTLTFTCTSTPSADITVNIMIVG